MVHEYEEVLAGEAMGRGPVMLSWREVDDADVGRDGYNVVIHEFAHGSTCAAASPPVRSTPTTAPSEAAGSALWRRSTRVRGPHRRRRGHLPRPYGAESLEEFFAVGAEAFFVAPHELETELPETYELLRSFFRQDPARSRAALVGAGRAGIDGALAVAASRTDTAGTDRSCMRACG